MKQSSARHPAGIIFSFNCLGSVECVKAPPDSRQEERYLSKTGSRSLITRLSYPWPSQYSDWGRMRLKCDGTRAETRFRLSAKRTRPFKSAEASVRSTVGSWGVRISCSNAGYTMFRGSVKGTGYPLHSSVFPLLPLPYVTVCHHVSTGLYTIWTNTSWSVCTKSTWLSLAKSYKLIL
jgi:hypothetical protein